MPELISSYFPILTTIVAIICNFLLIKHKQSSLSKISLLISEGPSNNKLSSFFKNSYSLAFFEIVLITLVQFALSVPFSLLFALIINHRANYYGQLFATYFLLILLFYIIGLNPLKQTDIFVFPVIAYLGVGKIGCFLAGCCYSFEWEHGFYNMKTERYEFPIQLVEAAVAFLILILLLYLYRKKKTKPGTLLPIYTILYSATRFCTDWFRRDLDPLFWQIHAYHLFAILGVIVGILELKYVLKNGQKLVELCDNSAVYNFAEKKVTRFRKKILDKRQKQIIHHQKKKNNKTKKTTRHK